MFIAGAATVSPEFRLSDSELISLGFNLERGSETVLTRSGIASRAVSFSPQTLGADLDGFDLFANWGRANCSPTSLGLKAARLALEQAGITIEQVGMALADTATPYQTCPSEAQRIIGEFGVKLPAYDSVGGAAALLQALSTIGAWNQERIPEYLLYVSTNTPSQQVSYCAKSLHGKSPHSCAATVIGDAAVALLLSTKHTGKARILSTRMSPEPIRRMPFRVEQSIAFNPELLAGEREVTDFIRSELGEALEINPAKVLVVPPPLYTRECATTLLGLGIGEDRLVSGVDQVGYSFGASLGVGLVRALERAKSGDQIVLLHCGDGLRGSVVLGVE